MPLKRKSFRTGFTLIELLATLTILSLITTFAVVNWSSFSNKQQIHLATQKLYHTLQYAKSEAIKDNGLVAVCGTTDFQQCHSDWSKGYMAFKVTSTNIAPADILRIEKKESPFPIHSKRRKVFTFRGNGQCLTRGSIYVGEPPLQKRIIIPDSGRLRIAEGK
jgi:type IV fimbrial biogenesis protein FimT